MRNLKQFHNFIFENEGSKDAEFITQIILKASSGPGTDEQLLTDGIYLIQDLNTLIKVNQLISKDGNYLHLQDLIDDELGAMDAIYKNAISSHLRKYNLLQHTKKLVAPQVIVTKDQVISSIIERVKKSESFVAKPYKDSKGIWTIGFGFNIQSRNDVAKKLKEVGVDQKNIDLIVTKRQGSISKPQAEKLLKITLSEAYDSAKSIFLDFQKHPLEIQGVLTDMVFNLGQNKIKQFNRFINYINSKKYNSAADEMKNSSWYRQVGDRAKDLEAIVRSIA